MKLIHCISLASAAIQFFFNPGETQAGVKADSQVRPVSVMLTAYSTTLLANGRDHALLRIAVTDSSMHELTSARDSVRVYISGDGRLKGIDGSELIFRNDTAGLKYAACRLEKGSCSLMFIAGTKPGKIKVEARSGKLWPGTHEIHTLPAGLVMRKPKPDQLPVTKKPIDRMIGADISFLPEIESRGGKFSDQARATDALALLRDHGFNYIRLRVFVNPENNQGYAPGKGYCGLKHTLEMAKRVKDAGMKLLLDFHYSDYWADPQQQNKPQH